MARDTLTGDLFAVPRPAQALAGSHDFRPVVAGLVGQALHAAVSDRHEIAASMSRLAGRDVSKYMLDAYSSGAREEFNLPLWLVPAFEASCQTHALTAWLVDVRGGRMLIGREALNAELGRLEQLREQASKRIREVKKQMGETE